MMTIAQREDLIHARYALDRAVNVLIGGADIVLATPLEKAIWSCIDAINLEIPEDKPTEWSDLAAERAAEIKALKEQIGTLQAKIILEARG
jgi:hypothetical protein